MSDLQVRIVVFFSVFGLYTSVFADSRDVAYKIFNRLNGVPPTNAQLDELTAIVEGGDLQEAAFWSMEDKHFYNLSLKHFVKPWSNVDQSPRVPLSDYVATVIGAIRDDIAFNQLLHEDIIYVGSDNLVNDPGLSIPAYSNRNNDHYVALENNQINLKEYLERKTQTEVSGIDAPAGIITTRAFGESYFKDGTNRRPLRFLLMTYLCRDLEQLHDPTRSDFRVRKDVPRSPGGDSHNFRNSCAGCHAGMDPMSGAFAYYDFVDDALVYNSGEVAEKMNRNDDVFPQGYQTIDDSWMNNWLAGPNARIGWNGPSRGNGAASLGQALAQTDEFPVCMSKKVYEFVCLQSIDSASDKDLINELADNFKKSGFKMKSLFADTVTRCLEE